MLKKNCLDVFIIIDNKICEVHDDDIKEELIKLLEKKYKYIDKAND